MQCFFKQSTKLCKDKEPALMLRVRVSLTESRLRRWRGPRHKRAPTPSLWRGRPARAL